MILEMLTKLICHSNQLLRANNIHGSRRDR